MFQERIAEIHKHVGDIIQRFEPSPRPARQKDSLAERGFANELQKAGERAVDYGLPPVVDRLIQQQSAKHGVSPDLIRAVVRAESGGNPAAVSKAGAVGLMQLMPQTAQNLGVNPYDMEENVDGGIRYLKEMATRFGSLNDVLAAYNAGPGAVEKHGGIPPYKETQDYVKKIRQTLREWRG